MTEASQILLRDRLKQLRLPTFQGEYAKLAQLCAFFIRALSVRRISSMIPT